MIFSRGEIESGKGHRGNSWLVIWRGKYACVCILPPALQRQALCWNSAGNSRESWRVSSSSHPPPFCWCVMLSLSLSLSLSKFRLAFRPLTPLHFGVSLGISARLWQSQPEGERGRRWGEGRWREGGFSMILPVNSAQHSVSVKLLPNVLHLPSLLFIPKTKLKVYYPNIQNGC